MKGVELPINTIVIIVLVLLLLIGILVFFLNVWNPSSGAVSLEAAKNAACQMLVTRGCSTDLNEILVDKFDANNNGKIEAGSTFNDIPSNDCGKAATVTSKDNLATLCACRYFGGTLDRARCRELCSC